MEPRKEPAGANSNMPKPHSRKAAFASAIVLAAGLMGCVSSSPPGRTTTVCESFGVPPRDKLREEMPSKPYTEADMALMQPPYAYVNCVTVEER